MNSLLTQLENRVHDLLGALQNAYAAADAAKAELAQAQQRAAEREDALKTELLQEQERARLEHTLLKQQHENNLAELNRALAAQIQAVQEQARAEYAQLQAEAVQLRGDNERYAALVSESRSLMQQFLAQSENTVQNKEQQP